MSNNDPHRRSFLSWLTAALLTAIALLLAVPGLAYTWSPWWKKRREEDAEAGFADAGPVADLTVGTWQLLTVAVKQQDGWDKTATNRSVWARRSGSAIEEITTFSPICPHLGCSILWQTESSQFMCPCHKGTFDAEGKVTGGPPPRGMDLLENQVKGGRLWVCWRDFKSGTPDRSLVGA